MGVKEEISLWLRANQSVRPKPEPSIAHLLNNTKPVGASLPYQYDSTKGEWIMKSDDIHKIGVS